MDIPIVVTAFSRPESLRRLLHSLEAAYYPDGVKLYISIDGDGPAEIVDIAESYEWKAGYKEVIRHNKSLGLRDHVMLCGDLSQKHDGIILLEDDLYVAPGFYDFAVNANKFYSTESKIAGISLYTHSFNETAEFPFYPINDSSDIFFMQMASSWGQCYSRSQWKRFREWYGKEHGDVNTRVDVPPNVESWPASSWKKHFIRYMIFHDLYFVYPRVSLCTNFGDQGINHKGDNHFQVPLMQGRKNYDFIRLDDSSVVYDSYCEILPSCLNRFRNDFHQFDYAVDLYGKKPLDRIAHEYLISSRKSESSLMHFGRKLIPHEANVIEDIVGDEIRLAIKKTFQTGTLGFTTARMVYFHRMPDWHRKTWRNASSPNGNLNEREEALLNLFSKPVYKPFLSIIIAFHRFARSICKMFYKHN